MLLIVAVIGNVRQQRQTTTNVLDVVKSITGQANENRQQHGLYAYYGFAAESHRLWMQEFETVSATRVLTVKMASQARPLDKAAVEGGDIHLF